MPTSAATLGLRSRPSLSECAARLARSRHHRGGLAPGASIPRLEAYATFPADHQRLAEFREICGEVEAAAAPIVWPHAVATPLQLHLITAPGFPVPALGLVMVRQVILQTLPIPSRADLHVRCRVDGHRRDRRGLELDLVTEVATQPASPPIWRGVTTALWPFDGASPARESFNAASDGERWAIPADVGRRYARCSRGFDPHDLHACAARWLDLPRPVVPEMWTLARCLAALGDAGRPSPLRIDARFHTPISLPGEVAFSQGVVGDVVRFAVHPTAPTWSGRPHLEGSWTRL